MNFKEIVHLMNTIRDQHGKNTKQGKILFMDIFYEHFPKYKLILLGNSTDIWVKGEHGYLKIPTTFYREEEVRFMSTTQYIEFDKIEVISEYKVPEYIIEMFLDFEHIQNKIVYYENLIKRIDGLLFEEDNYTASVQKSEYNEKIEELERKLLDEQINVYG